MDPILEHFCASGNTENCLRDILLRGLGSSTAVRHNTACCTVCCTPCARLDILQPGTRKYRKKPATVREISESLSKQLQVALEKERDKILAEKPSYRILGSQYICSDFVIQEICTRAKYITSSDDLNVAFLRPELRSRFYSVVMNFVVDAPPYKRRRKC